MARLKDGSTVGDSEILTEGNLESLLGYLPVDPTDLTWDNVSNKPTTFTPSTHAHSWAQVTGKPTTFTPSTHSHSWDDVTSKPSTFPSSWTQVTGKPSTFAPAAHSHSWTQVTDKPATFPSETHSHSWADVTSKPSTFTPSAHTHTIANVTGLQAAIDAKAGKAVATTQASGLMSSSDKTKLNGLSSNAATLQGRNASAFMQVVTHGTQASTARPVGAIAVYWIGTVEPNNAKNGDIWVGGA